MKYSLLFALIALLGIGVVHADDAYKSYLHEPSIPDSPEVRMFGQYSTSLFPGAATYTYGIDVPDGVNGFAPSIFLSYNSQGAGQRPGIVGSGWTLGAQNYVYRDINHTLADSSDDSFFLVLDANLYELVYNPSDERWHTEVDYQFKIDQVEDAEGTHWEITRKDGTFYSFGDSNATILYSGNAIGQINKWFLSGSSDTHGNSINYSYSKDPYTGDQNAIYLDTVTYNDDGLRAVEFTYENSMRPDYRKVLVEGDFLAESRRLSTIDVYYDDSLVRRYGIEYEALSASGSSISKIVHYGNDGVSILHNVSFDYYSPSNGYTKSESAYRMPEYFSTDTNPDLGIRLVDLNNDGYMDYIKYRYGEISYAYLNDKEGGWQNDLYFDIPVRTVHSDGTEMGVRFSDLNHDGYVDLLRNYNDVDFTYENTGHSWEETSFTIPVQFAVTGGEDTGVRLADVNGDSMIDIIQSKFTTRNVYLFDNDGWQLSSIVFPVEMVSNYGVDRGVRLVDVNGDGCVDILKGNGGTRAAWIFNGTGWEDSDVWEPSIDFITSSKPDTGVRFADVDGDGLIDMLEDYENGTASTKGAWINTGNGWVQNNSWQSPEAFTDDGKNTGRRLADVNGDGWLDILVSYDTTSQRYTWIRNSTVPYLLKSITNEYGGTVTINYTRSTRFNNTEDGLSQIGFNIYVVENVTRNGSVPGSEMISGTGYNYSFGKYDYEKNEFRGFEYTTEFRPYSNIVHRFYQDDPRRGKEYETEVYDSDWNPFSKNVKDYNFTYENGIYNLSLLFSTDYLYDGNEEPFITNKSYIYDFLGNMEYMVDHGDISIDGDEKYYNFSYAKNPTYWIMDKPARKTQLDSDGNKVSEIRYYYDNLGLEGVASDGDLTKVERWSDEGNHSFTYYEYDSYGNAIKVIDSLGNVRKIQYDESNTFLDTEIDALGYPTYYGYDGATGNLLWTEKSDIRTSYEYDEFGRISKEILPYDGNQSPTRSYEYLFDGSAPESITIRKKAGNSEYETERYYYDGFGNLVQLKLDDEDEQVVKGFIYDEESRVVAEGNPFYEPSDDEMSESAASYYTNYTYDAAGRVTSVIDQAGNEISVIFNRTDITEYDPNGNQHMYRVDAAGRIVEVREYMSRDQGADEYITRYSYDDGDNLIGIIDSMGNEFGFSYDSLGRKIAITDPDLGNWTYSYDTNDNLISQTDSRGEAIELEYDALNRVVRKTSDDANISFSYDQQYPGTLSSIEMGDIGLEYSYDKRMRVSILTMDIAGESLENSYLYDPQDRVVSEEGFVDIDYLLDDLGMVASIPGYIDSADYDASGRILNRSYSNGLTGYYGYDNMTGRLLSISVQDMMDLAYIYDPAGNVIGINDSLNGIMHSMEYDSLNRLKSVQIGDDIYRYTFNPIGNIMNIYSTELNSPTSAMIN